MNRAKFKSSFLSFKTKASTHGKAVYSRAKPHAQKAYWKGRQAAYETHKKYSPYAKAYLKRKAKEYFR